MSRIGRRWTHLAIPTPLESRALLSTLAPGLPHSRTRHPAAVVASFPASEAIPGNKGRIIHSQIDPFFQNGVGLQLWKVTAGRAARFGSSLPTGQGVSTGETPFVDAFNTGRISHTQFANGTFPAIGLQLRGIHLGGGLTVDSADQTSGVGSAGLPGIVGAPTNSGNLVHSQFNRGGFGKTGLQLFGTSIRGDLTVRSNIFLRDANGQPLRSTSDATTTTAPTAATPAVQALVNNGRIASTQFNAGGFGDTGLQWSRVKVGGSVGLGAEKYLVSPYPRDVAATDPIVGDRDLLSLDTINAGTVRNSQFNSGGFGDIGLQWSNVRVRRNVATADNNLAIEPQLDGQGPITINGLTFGQLPASATNAATASHPAVRVQAAVRVHAAAVRAAAVRAAAVQPVENDTLNSGRIVNSQVNDGGFGDLGAQWRDVSVGGGVSATHNSLSIEPRNVGQGLITVQNVHFPATPPASLTPIPNPRPGHTAKPAPALVKLDGRPVHSTLPTPTRPFQNRDQVNEATNSGTIRDSQFNDGGFGDVGLQWAHVRVRGNVTSIHNSLSVQPKGEGLEGVTVQNVSFGDPLPTSTTPSTPVAITTTPGNTGTLSSGDYANNTQFLDHQQVLDGPSPDVVLQWNQTYRNGGLVIVHNQISVPASSLVHVGDIRFLGSSPTATQSLNAQSVHAARTKTVTAADLIKNSATNSGDINGNQFSDGGIGGIGLQWRNLKVAGTVTVVRNTLSVNIADNPTGPVNISNVTFNSGALNLATPNDQRITYPPHYAGPIHAHAPVGRPLPQNPNVLNTATNSGILRGGQFQAGGRDPAQVDLQWRRATLRGSVTVIENVLTVANPPIGNGPITIDHVTFA